MTDSESGSLEYHVFLQNGLGLGEEAGEEEGDEEEEEEGRSPSRFALVFGVGAKRANFCVG